MGMLRMSAQGMTIEVHGATTGAIAGMISGQLGGTVVDKTALTGKYDVTLSFTPEMGMEQMMRTPDGGQTGDANVAQAAATAPSLFTALQEQLGLKLEARKEPTDVIVIDHIEQPSPN
jgi:uncharacterized protein (TIGR03435 family)